MLRATLAIAVLLTACKQKPSKLDEMLVRRDAAGSSDDGVTATTFAGQLEAIRAKLKVPAIGAAAWRNGTLLDLAAVGVRKEGDATQVTIQDQWHLGSNTKAMTATLIAIFVDRGKLRWDDTVAMLFAGWKIDPAFAHVTLDQLLRHQAGVAEDPPADLWKQLWDDGDAPDAREKFVRAILEKPPFQAPGTFVLRQRLSRPGQALHSRS